LNTLEILKLRKSKKQQKIYWSNRAIIIHRKRIKREVIKHQQKVGWLKYTLDIKIHSRKTGKESIFPKYERNHKDFKLGEKPSHSDTYRYLASVKNAFSNQAVTIDDTSTFELPTVFSLTEDEYSADSLFFLKRMFHALYHQPIQKIVLDYSKCERVDVDASVCLDILMNDYVHYYKQCRRKRHDIVLTQIGITNVKNNNIKKVLLSIGTFAIIRGIKAEFADVVPYPLCIADNTHPHASSLREVHITELVDHVIKCMKKMKKELMAQAEEDLFKVIGEVLINAEEHSSCKKRYSIGYFQDSSDSGEHVGIFNLVILNFGQTIYEKFSDPDCPNQKVVQRMKELSNSFTKNGLFSKAEFEEQTLWTLYALQEGVTSKSDWKRGNGSIRFIESFFNMKGSREKDNISHLSIVSGNTRIKFDGTYCIKEVPKGQPIKNFKMMTFNKEGDIEAKPDSNFVTFADNYFPGTLISAKICIKENNTQVSENEQ
jgi:hypothetical protein